MHALKAAQVTAWGQSGRRFRDARLWMVMLALAGCASSRTGPGPLAPETTAGVARRAPPPPPPVTPESDPDNVERRFGFGEARKRREDLRQPAPPAHQEVVVEPAKATTPPPSPRAPARGLAVPAAYGRPDGGAVPSLR